MVHNTSAAGTNALCSGEGNDGCVLRHSPAVRRIRAPAVPASGVNHLFLSRAKRHNANFRQACRVMSLN